MAQEEKHLTKPLQRYEPIKIPLSHSITQTLTFSHTFVLSMLVKILII